MLSRATFAGLQGAASAVAARRLSSVAGSSVKNTAGTRCKWIGAGLVAGVTGAYTVWALDNENRTAAMSKEDEEEGYRMTYKRHASSMSPLFLLQEILSKVTKIETALANPSRHGPGVDVVLGAQWGDEGKGKLVDLLSQTYDVCARVAGGANAGHTIKVNDKIYKLHLVPSGILSEQSVCVVGNGVVVHLPSFLDEVRALEKEGLKVRHRLLLSDRAHIVFDFHQTIDGLNESHRGPRKIGTTKKGIGPGYMSKMMRNGIRLGDLRYWNDFCEKFRALVKASENSNPGLKVDVEAELRKYKQIREEILPMLTDTIEYMSAAFVAGKRILVEGANATMLDIDFGTYPFVTSSNPSVGSVCTGGGIAPNRINNVYGIVKAYCTRVGEGPFPTELVNETGEYLCSKGHEYGTTTGRKRRCGWLDIPQMRYSVLVNGFTDLNLTKLDVLTGLDEVKIGIAYVHDGQVVKGMPSNLQVLEEATVEYETMPGWKEDISKCKKFEDLPAAAQAYVERVEELLGVHIRWIGVGPDRADVIERERKAQSLI